MYKFEKNMISIWFFFIPGSKIAIAYCNLEFQATHPDTGKESYVFNVGNVCTFKINPGLLYIINY